MPENVMPVISKGYAWTHEILLKLVDTLTDEQLGWTPNATAPSIGFHVWHLARWADYLQELINGPGSQLWEQEGLAAQWALATNHLGYAETGMSMDDQTARQLPLPGKARLLDYARRAFAKSQQAVSTISDEQFYRVYEDRHGKVWNDGHIGPIITGWMTHDSRHLGMVEGLVGVMGLPGSADD